MAKQKRRKKALPPRRKRMKRSARLQSAPHWLPTYTGKNIVRGYAKWFGVDLLCAVRELQLLGVEVAPAYVQALRACWLDAARCKTAEPKADTIPEGYGIEWDDNYGFIAGFTSGGAPFGLSWEELAAFDEE